jgi:hypothetical protein
MLPAAAGDSVSLMILLLVGVQVMGNYTVAWLYVSILSQYFEIMTMFRRRTRLLIALEQYENPVL